MLHQVTRLIPLAKITYHDGSEPTSSSFSLQSHPGYGPQGIVIHIEFTLKQNKKKTADSLQVQIPTDTCSYIPHEISDLILLCFRVPVR